MLVRFALSATLTLAFGLYSSRLIAEEKFREPVHAIAPNTLTISAAGRQGKLGFYASRNVGHADATVTRAIIVLHGRLRNAGIYFQSALLALQTAGEEDRVIVVAPQFLATADGAGRELAPDLLQWSLEGWQGGEDALTPAAISSFDALDGLIEQFTDKNRYPNLKTVVVAGHSGGGQVVQRYAILGRGETKLAAGGVHLRYVVANPSSYAYFSKERLNAGGFSEFAGDGCKGFNSWKYGLENLPRYAGTADAAQLEAAYIARDVVYLWGSKDTDPNHNALDKTCMAEAEGPNRLARGQFYLAYLQARHGEALRHRGFLVPGVGHSGDRMLTSPCGLWALFDQGECDGPAAIQN